MKAIKTQATVPMGLHPIYKRVLEQVLELFKWRQPRTVAEMVSEMQDVGWLQEVKVSGAWRVSLKWEQDVLIDCEEDDLVFVAPSLPLNGSDELIFKIEF